MGVTAAVAAVHIPFSVLPTTHEAGSPNWIGRTGWILLVRQQLNNNDNFNLDSSTAVLESVRAWAVVYMATEELFSSERKFCENSWGSDPDNTLNLAFMIVWFFVKG